MPLLECITCGGKLKTEQGRYTATCECCGNEMTVFESTAEFEVDSRGVLVQYNGKGGDVVVPESTVKIGPEAFRDNQRIFSITLPDSIVEIGANAFRNCGELEEINLPESLETIGEQAFRDCAALREITIPTGVLAIPTGLFVDCHNLETVRLHDSIRTIEASAFVECKRMKNFRLPKRLRRLGDFALCECTALTQLELPEGLQVIGQKALAQCTGLTNIRIPDSVHTMGKCVFLKCSGLKEATIGTGLTELPESTFEGCSALEKIHIPDNIITIADCAFRDCTSLASIQLPQTVRDIHFRAFYGANNLSGTLEIPAGVQSVGFALLISKVTHLKIGKAIENVESMSYHFPQLEKITIYEGAKIIPHSLFTNCHSLKSIELPSTLETIGHHAFSFCTALQSIHIPAVKTIHKSAFIGCRALHTVRIGEGCREIEADAFYSSECNKRTYHLPGSIQSISDEALYTVSSTIHSPNNAAIRNYCSRDSSSRWVHEPSAAEIEQARAQQLQQARAQQRKKERASLETYKANTTIKLGNSQRSLSYHRSELANAEKIIRELEAELPKLNGIFHKKKRKECEERLELYRKRRTQHQYGIKAEEAEIAKLEQTLQYCKDKLASL